MPERALFDVAFAIISEAAICYYRLFRHVLRLLLILPFLLPLADYAVTDFEMLDI